jgi:asparagine N-glycosylation enzyme membrane subunit Stt3
LLHIILFTNRPAEPRVSLCFYTFYSHILFFLALRGHFLPVSYYSLLSFLWDLSSYGFIVSHYSFPSTLIPFYAGVAAFESLFQSVAFSLDTSLYIRWFGTIYLLAYSSTPPQCLLPMQSFI